MAKIIENVRKTWEAITFPDGIDEDYDERCDKAFYKLYDRFISVCYFIFFVFSVISLYFFITREIL
tara:strand:+ start:567 stop:764 length:198 start_codon:yes stop_codon:yes gene_type:complete